jgi:hypothetical protein
VGQATVVRNCFDLAALNCLEQENQSQEESDTRADILILLSISQAIVAPKHLRAEECWASDGPLSTDDERETTELASLGVV